MAATISTNTSTSALSPSGAWWATASTEKASRVTIRQAESLRVHCTLRNNNSNTTAAVAEWSTNDAGSSPPRRVLQWLSETLVATMTRNQSNTVILTVFDVTRGVVAYTKEYSFGSNSSTSDVAALRDTDHADVADYTFVDWAVALLPQQQKPQSVVDTLVVAVQTKRSKLLLLVYHAATGKLLQKIKAGKANTASSSSSSSSSFCALAMGSSSSDGKNDLAVWHCGSHLRVTSLVTGLKVAKISLDRHGHNSLATYASSQLIWSVAGHLAAAIPGTKGSTTTTTTTTVMLYNVRTGLRLNGPILGLSSSSPSATIQLAVSGSGDDGAKSSYWLLLDSQSLIQLTITTAEDAQEADSFVVTKTCRLSTPLPTMDDCIQYYFTSSQLVAVRHTSLASTTAAHGLQVCRVDMSKALDEIAVSFDAESNAITTNAAAAALESKKRKPTVVLGPGQAGGEARHVTEVGALSNKRSKSAESDPTDRTNDDQDNDNENDDDDNGPTIAERLAQLQKIMDEDMEMDDEDDKDTNAATTTTTTTTSPPFVPRHATTESLAHLLTQALQSSDTVLLEQALAVRDAALVRTTCRGLDATSAVALLQALTQRLATKPARAEQLVPWMAALLQSNHVSSVQQLQPLQNLLQERLEVFPLLLQLEGRLEHMTATM
jgi:Dip2/Utp12 Family